MKKYERHNVKAPKYPVVRNSDDTEKTAEGGLNRKRRQAQQNKTRRRGVLKFDYYQDRYDFWKKRTPKRRNFNRTRTSQNVTSVHQSITSTEKVTSTVDVEDIDTDENIHEKKYGMHPELAIAITESDHERKSRKEKKTLSLEDNSSNEKYLKGEPVKSIFKRSVDDLKKESKTASDLPFFGSSWSPWDLLIPREFWEEYPFIREDLDLSNSTNFADNSFNSVPTVSYEFPQAVTHTIDGKDSWENESFIPKKSYLGATGITESPISSKFENEEDFEDYIKETSLEEESVSAMPIVDVVTLEKAKPEGDIPTDESLPFAEAIFDYFEETPEPELSFTHKSLEPEVSFTHESPELESDIQTKNSISELTQSLELNPTTIKSFTLVKKSSIEQVTTTAMPVVHQQKVQQVEPDFVPNQTKMSGTHGTSTFRAGSTLAIPGYHFPNYHDIPMTSFTCSKKRLPGFYADMETSCQVFHVCYQNRRESFLCPVGTVFNQAALTCDYWYSTNCSLTNYFIMSEKTLYPTTRSPVSEEINYRTTQSSLETTTKNAAKPTTHQRATPSSTSRMPSSTTRTPSNKNFSTDLRFFSRFFPIKSKVTIYPAAGEKRAKIVAETSVGRDRKRRPNIRSRTKTVVVNSTQTYQKGIDPEVNKIIDDAFGIARQVLEQVGSLFPRKQVVSSTTITPFVPSVATRRPISSTMTNTRRVPTIGPKRPFNMLAFLPTLNPRFIVKPIFPGREITKRSAPLLDDYFEIRKQ